MRTEQKLWNLFYAGPVLALAFGLRVYRLSWQSLWYDEGNSAFMTGRSVPEIIAGAAADIHPPLYYILLSWWSHLGGSNEYGLRFLSVAFGLLLVAVVYKLGQKLFVSQAGLAAAAITAISPFLVYYSQEARMYMQGAFLCALAGLFFVKALEKDRYWPAYTLTAAAAIYTQYYALGVIVAFNIFFVLAIVWRSGRGLWARWLAANVVAAALYVPWLPSLAGQAAMWPRAAQAAAPASEITRSVYWIYLLGPLQPKDLAASMSIFVMSFPAAAVLAISAMAWPGLSHALRIKSQGILGRWMGLLFVLTAVLVSWYSLLVPFWRSPFQAKFLIFGLPWLYVWLGMGTVSLACAGRYFFHGVTLPFRRKDRQVSGISWLVPLISLTSLPLLALCLAAFTAAQWYYFDPRNARDDYRSLARQIETQAQPGDAVLLNAPGQREIFGYYYRGEIPVYPLPRERPLVERDAGQDLGAIASDHSRLWLVLWGQQESDPSSFIERWLDRKGYKSADRWYGGVRLLLYAVPRPGEERSVPIEARMGDYARLARVSFPGVPPTAGNPLVRAPSAGIVPLSLHWEAISAAPKRYKVFVHLLGPNDTLWGQHDSEPDGGSRPTTAWRPGESITDNHGLPIPPGTPPGNYEIEIGLYDVATGQRLPVYDPDGKPAGDRVVMSQVEVLRPATFPPKETLVIERTLEARFQDISLLGYEFFKLGTEAGNIDFRRGDLAHLSLFWTASAEKPGAYPLRVALLDSNNREVGLYKGTAVDNYPTVNWSSGELVIDQYKIPLVEAPGIYRLAVYVASGTGGTPISPEVSASRVVDGKLLLTELHVK